MTRHEIGQKAWRWVAREKGHWIWLFCGFATLCSVGISAWASLRGICYRDPCLISYFDKPNWYMYPAFWWPVCLAVYASWWPFFHAWDCLYENNMLAWRLKDAATVRGTAEDFSNWNRRSLSKTRWFAILASAIGAVALSAADFCQEWDQEANLASVLPSTKADSEPSPEAVIVCNRQGPADVACRIETTNASGCPPTKLGSNLSPDWVVACKREGQADMPMKKNPRGFLWVAYAQEAGIGALGLLVILQLLINIRQFWSLGSKGRSGDINGVKGEWVLRLDPLSPLQEFGLERWNHALNNFYWVISLALLVPIASVKYGASLSGRWVLWIGGILLVLLPISLTIISRQQLLPHAWAAIKGSREDTIKRYHQQCLWPLTKDWSSKLGLILALTLLGVLLGKNLDLFNL